jgi:hypothetical protein
VFEFGFEELPLLTGRPHDGKPQSLALVTGEATIRPDGDGYAVDEIKIADALTGDWIWIERKHPLFPLFRDSLIAGRDDAITEKLVDFLDAAADDAAISAREFARA